MRVPRTKMMMIPGRVGVLDVRVYVRVSGQVYTPLWLV